MALLSEIVSHTNDFLQIDRFKDYCPNGLQVEGKSEVKKIVSGVTSSQAMIDAAAKASADVLLVHHGFFWRGENPVLVGLKKNRIASLIQNNMSLLTYHLPLDAHETVGNNAQIAKLLDLEIEDSFGPDKPAIGVIAKTKSPIDRETFSKQIGSALERAPTVLTRNNETLYRKIAICTGAAQSYFEEAIDSGADAFITGEVSEQSYHLAMESGVDFYAAGHHATERYGVQALGDYLSKQFNIVHEYIDIKNPV